MFKKHCSCHVMVLFICMVHTAHGHVQHCLWACFGTVYGHAMALFIGMTGLVLFTMNSIYESLTSNIKIRVRVDYLYGQGWIYGVGYPGCSPSREPDFSLKLQLFNLKSPLISSCSPKSLLFSPPLSQSWICPYVWPWKNYMFLR